MHIDEIIGIAEIPARADQSAPTDGRCSLFKVIIQISDLDLFGSEI
jgi:hypothetical protein